MQQFQQNPRVIVR